MVEKIFYDGLVKDFRAEDGKLLGCRLHKNGKWQARIMINGKRISLGYYNTEIEAHEAYKTTLTMLDKPIDEIKEHFGIRTKDKCTSKYKGVSFHKASNKWQAQPTIDGKQKYQGLFETEEEAYQSLAKYLGEDDET